MHLLTTFKKSTISSAICIALTGTFLISTSLISQAYAIQKPVLSEKQQLDKLADAYYKSRAKLDPLTTATINGDARYNAQLGLSIAEKNRKQQFALMHRMQKQFKQINRAKLGEKDQLNYDLFAYDLSTSLHFEHFPEHLLPINQMDNVPSTLANYASGTGAHPFKTVADYNTYLSRLNQLPAWINQAISNMQQGIKQGIVHPKAITIAMLPQIKQLQSKLAKDSIYYTPINNLPAQFSDKEKQKLSHDYQQTIQNMLSPAIDRLVTFLETDYLKAGRDSTGYSALPNGAAWYQMRIKDHTTTDLTPDQIHQLGLQEMARIQKLFVELGPKLGYTGPANELPQWVSKQAKFKSFTTDKEVLAAYRVIDAQVNEQLPKLFSLLPKGKLDLQLEPELSKATASDHYTPPAADGSYPGIFWPVVNDPKDYSRTGMASLYLHEGQPGHHLHAALLKEIDLPDFRKFNTENFSSAAFTEGWALYSETLGKELGLYDNPEAYVGHLTYELLRAVRLVVDTGMHAKGWTREQAISFMEKNLGYSQAAAKNQVERYMVLPGQALSYKIGSMKILELRAKAQAALGDKFSLPKFHEIVIGDGTLPLPILEAQVNKWIATSSH